MLTRSLSVYSRFEISMTPSLKRFIALFLIFTTSFALRAQEIGLQLHSLRHEFEKDVPATMEKIKAFGIKNIEMGSTYGLPFHEFIKLLAKNELNVISFGADFDKLEKNPQAVADEARMYGAKYVVCAWIPHQNNFTIADVQKAATVFNKAAQVMALNGLLFCYHPHGYEFQSYADGNLFDELMNALDTRYVYLEMDVFWIKQAGQDPVTLLKKYPSRWVLLHLKDRKAGTPTSTDGHVDVETNVVLGTGDVGIAEIVKEAKNLGIQHFFIEDESSLAVTQIPKSIAYLKSLE